MFLLYRICTSRTSTWHDGNLTSRKYLQICKIKFVLYLTCIYVCLNHALLVVFFANAFCYCNSHFLPNYRQFTVFWFDLKLHTWKVNIIVNWVYACIIIIQDCQWQCVTLNILTFYSQQYTLYCYFYYSNYTKNFVCTLQDSTTIIWLFNWNVLHG